MLTAIFLIAEYFGGVRLSICAPVTSIGSSMYTLDAKSPFVTGFESNDIILIRSCISDTFFTAFLKNLILLRNFVRRQRFPNGAVKYLGIKTLCAVLKYPFATK